MLSYFSILLLVFCTSSLVIGLKINDFGRQVKGITGSLLLVGTSFIHPAISADLKTYTSDRYHTSIGYPADYQVFDGTLSSERQVVAFTSPKDADTSVSIVFTPIPADYTKLNSFGGKETIRQYLLPKGDGILTKMIDEYVKGESYFLEYVVSAPEAPVRHIQSVFSLRPQESVVGLTIQTKEETYPENRNIFTSVLPTFKTDNP